MKKILIIDNTRDADSIGSEEIRRALRVFPVVVETRRGPEDDLPSSVDGYDRIIVSGSRTSCLEDGTWIDHQLELLRSTVQKRRPLLGICFGHQMLARALGGKTLLRRAEQGEVGWTLIHRTTTSLFEGLPSQFYSFSSHEEEVAHLPSGFRKLAHSDRCAIQAFQLGESPIFGIQFHPEKNCEEGEKILTTRQKMGKSKELLGLKQGRRLYSPQVAEVIFRNFMNS